MSRYAWVLGLLLAAAMMVPTPLPSQSALERGPNLEGSWVSEAGVAHFHVIHRFWVTSPPARKVINTPTLVVGAGLGRSLLAGFRYGSNSALIPGEFNEWDAFVRWRPVTESSSGLADVGVSAGYNNVAGSVDGELALSRAVGPVTLHGAARGFSSFAGGDAAGAFGGGAVWRLGRNVALAGDVMTLASMDTTAAWSVGLQLRIPLSPHTLSLHVTNANLTTLQSSSIGGLQTLYGFEFTVPITFSRYFGGGLGAGSGGSASGQPAAGAPSGPSAGSADTVVVSMDNRLRFLPDTVRIQAGQTVRWENASDIVHTVTADPRMAALESSVRLPEGADPFDSGDLVPGNVYVRTFDVPGSYTYFCIPHERAGMVGVILVEESG